MKCPNCAEVLVMAERQGIEIDYCPKCRGVWLDKGELDKIIERSQGAQAGQQQEEKNYKFNDDDDDDREFSDRNKGEQGNRPHKKRGGFLSNLFDFD